MKILIINGSPHIGNTWTLTQSVKDILYSFDNEIDFTEIHLTNINIPFCTGCSNCFRKDNQYCPHYKKIQPILDLIEENDAVIFSVSCFQGHLTGIMKNFTDHLAFLIHRPRFFYKKAMIISTTGGVSADSTTKSLALTIAGWGFNKSYQLPIVSYSWNAYKPTQKDLQKANKIAYKFYKDVKSKKMHSPSIGVLIPFNLFQIMYPKNNGNIEFPTEDNNFWPKYKGMKYALGIPLPFYKYLLASLINLIGYYYEKRMIITYKK